MPLKKLPPQELSPDTERQINETRANAYAANTRKGYNTDWKQFQTFCLDHDLEGLPASPRTLEIYINSIKDRYKLSTILRKVSAISKGHARAKVDNPVVDIDFKEYLKGLKNERKVETTDKAEPLLKTDIERVCLKLQAEDSPRAMRDQVILLLGFFGAFRRSELVELKWDDLKRDDDGYTATVRFSKSDQTGEGQVKFLPYQAKVHLCPVRTLDTFRNRHTSDYVFPSMSSRGKILKPQMSAKAVDRLVKRYFGAGYSAHSLRAGFITAAANAGAAYHEISKQSGHKHMPTLQGYIRNKEAKEGNAVLKL